MVDFPNKKNSVLVVEDDEVLLEMIVEWLGANGLDADGAPDGETDLSKIHEKEYDVVLADLNLPGISGMELIQKLITMEGSVC